MMKAFIGLAWLAVIIMGSSFIYTAKDIIG